MTVIHPKNNTSTTIEAPTTSQHRDFESLPDFVLIQILKHLPLVDLYNVSLLSSRFEALAISFRASHQLNVAEFYAKRSAWSHQQLHHSYRQLLANVGQHIDALIVEMFYVRETLNPVHHTPLVCMIRRQDRVTLDAIADMDPTLKSEHQHEEEAAAAAAALVAAAPPSLPEPEEPPALHHQQHHQRPQSFNESAFLRCATEHIGGRLRRLHVRSCDLDTSWDDYGELLVNVRSLHLESCRSQTGYRNCHAPIADYRMETVYDDTDDRMPDAYALLAMRELRDLTIIRCKHTLHVPQIEALIARNVHLRHVRIHHDSQMGSATLLPTIRLTLGHQLETLSLHYGTTKENDLRAIAELTALRKLQLLNYYVPTAGLVGASRPLEMLLPALHGNGTIVELDLYHSRISAVALECCATWTALRVLKLRKNYWIEAEAARAIARIGRLERLDCYDALNLTDDDMVEIVHGNRRMELLDASWVVQLTGAVVSGLRDEIARRTLAQLGENGRRRERGEAEEKAVPFRVILNGRNRIDWTEMEEANGTTTTTTAAASAVAASSSFRAIAYSLDGGDAAKSAMFRVFYETCQMKDVMQMVEDWAKKYSDPIYEIR